MSASFKGNGFEFPLGKKTYIMGILNITPDSFSDGGLYSESAAAAERALEMARQGADIIDIGAQSTRPGYTPVPPQEEINRLEPVLNLLRDKGLIISVDTYYPEVARFALDNGAFIINDVSGVFNKDMAKLIKARSSGWIITHTGGSDASGVVLYEDITLAVNEFFDSMLNKATAFGLDPDSLCLDCGIGFGKSYEDNIAMLRNAALIKRQNTALMYGASRKRVTACATERENINGRLYATIAAHTAAILGGADIIRVHDVEEALRAAEMADAILGRGEAFG